jgi:hypothetical protein
MAPMTLREVLLNIKSFEDDATVFVTIQRPVTLISAAAVATLEEDDGVPPEVADMEELMDIWHVRDILAGIERLKRDELGRCASQEELLDRFMLYLKNDA